MTRVLWLTIATLLVGCEVPASIITRPKEAAETAEIDHVFEKQQALTWEPISCVIGDQDVSHQNVECSTPGPYSSFDPNCRTVSGCGAPVYRKNVGIRVVYDLDWDGEIAFANDELATGGPVEGAGRLMCPVMKMLACRTENCSTSYSLVSGPSIYGTEHSNIQYFNQIGQATSIRKQRHVPFAFEYEWCQYSFPDMPIYRGKTWIYMTVACSGPGPSLISTMVVDTDNPPTDWIVDINGPAYNKAKWKQIAEGCAIPMGPQWFGPTTFHMKWCQEITGTPHFCVPGTDTEVDFTWQ